MFLFDDIFFNKIAKAWEHLRIAYASPISFLPSFLPKTADIKPNVSSVLMKIDRRLMTSDLTNVKLPKNSDHLGKFPKKIRRYFYDVFHLFSLPTWTNFILLNFSAQFFAHSHKDDFRLQMFEPEVRNNQQDTTKSFVLLAPAISPVYHNNPAFKLMSLDTEQLSLVDYSQYYMDLVMATG